MRLPWLCLLLLLAAISQARTAAESPATAHWAFQPPRASMPPSVRNGAWVRNPLDAFVLAELEAAGLTHAPSADAATLLRRVTIDLTGLPPTPEELEHFLGDSRPDAYEQVVERLLASPHYGERWAQHWLDVVRYAESNGYEIDSERPHAWRYRDYIIRALNNDKPFYRFLTEQIAGDELAKGQNPVAHAETLVAAGFNRCGPIHLVSGNTDPEINRQEVLTEMTNGIGAAFLGLTIGCARCHDHKFDPISQADYYGLQAFFAAAQPKDIDIATTAERSAHKERLAALDAQLVPLKKQVAEIEAPYQKRLTEVKKAKLEPAYRAALAVEASKRTPEQKKLVEHANILIKVSWDELVDALTPADRTVRAGLRQRIHDLEAQKPPPTGMAWTLADGDKPSPTHILKRGDPKRKGAEVKPAFPHILAPESGGPASRLDLARWLTQPNHPLSARVFVNRLWQHHFGRGLVATPNDFGVRGQPPSHPELLDWLALEFVAHGWSVKHMHRLMVLSNTYQQTSRRACPGGVDLDNRLLWRMNRQRLEGEALRDCALAATGTLNPKLGGPMIRVPLEPEVYELIFTEGEPDGLWPVTPDVREHTCRSIYLFAKRNVHLPLFEAFDQPDTLNSCAARAVSTFAPQALILLNGPFMQEQAKALARRLQHECGDDVDRMIERAYRLTLSRPPGAQERVTAREFLSKQTAVVKDRQAALADFCLALLNCNEFVYLN